MISLRELRTATGTRILRFGISGLLATLVHVIVASLWIYWIDKEPSLANAIAFSVATGVSFVMNTKWSFTSKLGPTVFIRFTLVALVGLLLSALIAHGVDLLGFSYPYGIAAVVCVMPPVNFLLHHFWTYRMHVTCV